MKKQTVQRWKRAAAMLLALVLLSALTGTAFAETLDDGMYLDPADRVPVW